MSCFGWPENSRTRRPNERSIKRSGQHDRDDSTPPRRHDPGRRCPHAVARNMEAARRAFALLANSSRRVRRKLRPTRPKNLLILARAWDWKSTQRAHDSSPRTTSRDSGPTRPVQSFSNAIQRAPPSSAVVRRVSTASVAPRSPVRIRTIVFQRDMPPAAEWAPTIRRGSYSNPGFLSKIVRDVPRRNRS